MKIIERMDIAGQNSWWGARMLISLVEFQSRNILRLLFPSIKTSIKLCDKKCERLILSLSSPEWWHSMRSSWCPSASWWSSQVRSHNISPVLYLDDNKEFLGKTTIITPFLYYRFLGLRYGSRRNPYCRSASFTFWRETLFPGWGSF